VTTSPSKYRMGSGIGDGLRRYQQATIKENGLKEGKAKAEKEEEKEEKKIWKEASDRKIS